jgi:hypothetical protein
MALLYSTESSYGWLFHYLKLDDVTPSLRFHYRTFLATTDDSAPVSRIGTLTLVGPPLAFLPWHRDDRFSRSVQEPESRSRHLYAGRRSDSKQVSFRILPRVPLDRFHNECRGEFIRVRRGLDENKFALPRKHGPKRL